MMSSSPDSVLLLYCFAFAGSSAQVFRDWQRAMPANVKVRPVELPGRGRRAAEPLVSDYTELVERLTREVAEDIVTHQRQGHRVLYASYGHSAGAAFSFGVCSRLAERLGQPPVHCFLAAGPAPHTERKQRARMSDTELTEELRSLSGTPPGIVDNPEVLAFFLPILRADFSAHEQAVRDSQRMLDCPVTLFAASDDELPAEHVWAWARYTAHPVRQAVVQGGHFSILQSPALLANLRNDLALNL